MVRKKIPKAGATKRIETTPVTTKTLASDGGLEETLKKIGGVLLGDPLVTLGATEQPSSVTLERVENNPRVFLGVQDKKGGELSLTLLALQPTMDPLRTNKTLLGLQMHALFYAPPGARTVLSLTLNMSIRQRSQLNARLGCPTFLPPSPLTKHIYAWTENLSNDPERAILLKRLRDAFRIVSRYSDLRPAEVMNYKSETMFATKLKR